MKALTSLEVCTGPDLWEKFIDKIVKGEDTKGFIMNNIFPRPRDLIYFLSSAKNLAVSRGHSKITEEDIISAYTDYSNWVFKSIIVENGITIKQMEDFMYNLMGENQIQTEESIKNIAIRSNIDVSTKELLDKFIDHMVSLTILGREIRRINF